MGNGEWKHLGKTWWCRGGGAAVMMLVAVVSVFRDARDFLFWSALAFFAAHTVMTVRRYLRERRSRGTATVIRHHRTHAGRPATGPLIFTPPAANSLVLVQVPPPK